MIKRRILLLLGLLSTMFVLLLSVNVYAEVVISGGGISNEVSCTVTTSSDSSGNVLYTYDMSVSSFIITDVYVEGLSDSELNDLRFSNHIEFSSYSCDIDYAVSGVSALDNTVSIDDYGTIYAIGGQCGDNVYWYAEELSGGKYKLTIKGTGAMYSYDDSDDLVPWHSIKTSISEVEIQNGVTTIGAYAFSSCKSLTSITIPNSVTTIGLGAFVNCTSLTSVAIPDSVTTIGYYAFYNCSSLTSVKIPNSVTWIGTWTFRDCSSLTSVTIPDSVTTIGEGAFASCKSFTSVTIPNSVTEIGDNAFYNCTSLTSVTALGDGVSSIGSNIFTGCTALKYAYISSNLGNNNFVTQLTDAGASVLSFNKANGSITKHKLQAGLTELVIPAKIGGYTVKGIGDNVFRSCSSLASITIPNSVTTIGTFAFDTCTSLTSITIPNSVTTIGDAAFYNCTSLTSITIPDGVTTIGHGTFHNCTSLTSVTIPNSVTTIGDVAFCNCSLTSITIPDSVTTIGNSAFHNCTSLTSVTIPNSVTTIGDAAFYQCASLTSVTIPNSVTTIGNDAFGRCSSLTSVTALSDSMSSIGSRIFTECTALEIAYLGSNTGGLRDTFDAMGVNALVFNKDTNTITGSNIVGDTDIVIPESIAGYDVTTIGDDAFSNCTSLTSVKIPNSVTTIGKKAFYNCTSLTSVTIPNSVTTIGAMAFRYCTSLTSVTLPNSVTTISAGAFADCTSLISVTIPDSVITIGNDAFGRCSSLTSITIPDSVTKIQRGAFSGCSIAKLVIPEATVNINASAFNSDTELYFIADTVPSNVASSSLNYITGYTPFENINVTADWKTLKAAISIGGIDKTNTAAYMSWATGERAASYFSNPSTVNSLSENQTISDIAFNNTIVTLFWKDSGGNKVTKVINLTKFYESTKCENITYGQTLGNVTVNNICILGKNTLPFLGGVNYEIVSSFKNIKPNAGSRVVDISFTPNNRYAGYSVYSKNMPITVDKITPVINTKPTASAITYTQTLASSSLSGGSCNYAGTWSWTDNSIKPNAGTRSYSVTFTPTDSTNVKQITADISLSVAKYSLDVSGATASDITYGDTLSESVISMN